MMLLRSIAAFESEKITALSNKFERAVIFSDSKAAILSAGSTETVISTEAKDCQALIRQLKAKHKQFYCSGYQGIAKLQKMNMPIHWPKRVLNFTNTY